MKQRWRSATCQARSKFRWKWKKKRTRRLQKKRRKMRQRSKWRGTTNFTVFQVSQKWWWVSWTKFRPCSQIFWEAERRQMTKQEVRGVTMRQWHDRQNGWVGAFEGPRLESWLDWNRPWIEKVVRFCPCAWPLPRSNLISTDWRF